MRRGKYDWVNGLIKAWMELNGSIERKFKYHPSGDEFLSIFGSRPLIIESRIEIIGGSVQLIFMHLR